MKTETWIVIHYGRKDAKRLLIGGIFFVVAVVLAAEFALGRADEANVFLALLNASVAFIFAFANRWVVYDPSSRKISKVYGFFGKPVWTWSKVSVVLFDQVCLDTLVSKRKHSLRYDSYLRLTALLNSVHLHAYFSLCAYGSTLCNAPLFRAAYLMERHCGIKTVDETDAINDQTSKIIKQRERDRRAQKRWGTCLPEVKILPGGQRIYIQPPGYGASLLTFFGGFQLISVIVFLAAFPAAESGHRLLAFGLFAGFNLSLLTVLYLRRDQVRKVWVWVDANQFNYQSRCCLVTRQKQLQRNEIVSISRFEQQIAVWGEDAETEFEVHAGIDDAKRLQDHLRKWLLA